MRIRTLLPALPFLLVLACSSASSKIDGVWSDLEREAKHATPLADPDADDRAARQERANRAREIVNTGELETARDHFRAAVLLAESDLPADWDMAARLGAKAAQLGEPMGLRVAAEAIDKDLVAQGLPQRYGTQFSWNPVRRAWRLVPIDPVTSDAERASMGVPSYVELIRAEAQMNAHGGS